MKLQMQVVIFSKRFVQLWPMQKTYPNIEQWKLRPERRRTTSTDTRCILNTSWNLRKNERTPRMHARTVDYSVQSFHKRAHSRSFALWNLWFIVAGAFEADEAAWGSSITFHPQQMWAFNKRTNMKFDKVMKLLAYNKSTDCSQGINSKKAGTSLICADVLLPNMLVSRNKSTESAFVWSADDRQELADWNLCRNTLHVMFKHTHARMFQRNIPHGKHLLRLLYHHYSVHWNGSVQPLLCLTPVRTNRHCRSQTFSCTQDRFKRWTQRGQK